MENVLHTSVATIPAEPFSFFFLSMFLTSVILLRINARITRYMHVPLNTFNIIVIMTVATL